LFVQHDRPLRRLTVALSFPSDRAFVAFYDPPPSIPAAIKGLAVAQARAAYVEGLYAGGLLDAGLGLIRAKGMKILMDGNGAENMDLSEPSVRKVLKAIDVFLPNAQEACHLAGVDGVEEATRILASRCRLVVVKDGGQGALTAIEGKLVRVPALPLEALETTGAGDTFNAGFICAWLEGRPLPECLAWGNVVGGLSTLSPGGTGRRVGRSEVEVLLPRLNIGASKPEAGA
jgi:sugar/nucleoside kinase (ribokinase family)